MKYPLSHDRIVFEICLHKKSLMLYRPALHGNWRALKDKFPTPTVPLTTVLPNCQVFLPDPIYDVKHLLLKCSFYPAEV
jgi:hypothetical protein